ncbi:related to DASH complex subunit spc19 (Outer kinetochore protein spc19) [Sporisorium reilianum SRZ2]|uniref:DASH complex subunit SPC19 n=1 Tax=Sporisorium reilianum (strain SRZ2) TaxID=999809 RepID=E7A2S5_SPORE|nr:related to DASH complex subunit spc19 (Outer kinetochore protein spc19) [Sporisorium reilianum SRZ2]
MLMPRQSSFPQHQMMQQQQQQGQFDAPYLAQQQQHMPQPSQHLISSLQHCVSSTASCVQTMKEAIDTLEFAIQDHPRLMTVLKSRRHFDLVSQHDIEHAREHVASEVRPHIEELCRRASAEIARQDRRAVALRNKHESLQQRLQNLRSIDLHQSKLLHNSASLAEAEEERLDSQEHLALKMELEQRNLRLAQLKKRKEALLATADKLESETQGHL